jgi:hypothetical protein
MGIATADQGNRAIRPSRHFIAQVWREEYRLQAMGGRRIAAVAMC